MLLWVSCIAGALNEGDHRTKLAAAGFKAIDVEPARVNKLEEAREFLTGKGLDVDALARQVDGKFLSAFVRAAKPKAAAAIWVASNRLVEIGQREAVVRTASMRPSGVGAPSAKYARKGLPSSYNIG